MSYLNDVLVYGLCIFHLMVFSCLLLGFEIDERGMAKNYCYIVVAAVMYVVAVNTF